MDIFINVKPNASKNDLIKRDENHWDLFVTKSAINGEANKAVIEVVSKELGIAKSRVSIKSGLKSKHKVLEII